MEIKHDKYTYTLANSHTEIAASREAKLKGTPLQIVSEPLYIETKVAKTCLKLLRLFSNFLS